MKKYVFITCPGVSELKVTTLQGHSRDVLSISFDPEDTVKVGHGWSEAVANSQWSLGTEGSESML